MPINITMPALSPTMEEGNLAKWLVKEGDQVKSGDVILAVDGQEVGDRRSLYRLLWTHRPGEPVTLKIFRGRELRSVTVASGDVEEFFG